MAASAVRANPTTSAKLTTTAIRRITRELADIRAESNSHFTVALINDKLSEWEAKLKGPENSPYEGGVFRVSIVFPANYPFRPPMIRSLQPIYHPNISSNGDICLDILKHQWAPILTISKVLLSLISLFCDPNPSDALVVGPANLYLQNRSKYNDTAKEWTRRHATPKDA